LEAGHKWYLYFLTPNHNLGMMSKRASSSFFSALFLTFFLSTVTLNAQNAVVTGSKTPNPHAVLISVGNGSDGKEYVGILAQDVLPVAPYMITTVRRKLKDSDQWETDILKYDANALTYILVNAIKEQQKEIDSLRNYVACWNARQQSYSCKK
jgi:hypothetical protein